MLDGNNSVDDVIDISTEFVFYREEASKRSPVRPDPVKVWLVSLEKLRQAVKHLRKKFGGDVDLKVFGNEDYGFFIKPKFPQFMRDKRSKSQ